MSYRAICALGDSITNGYWDEEGLGWFGRLSMKIAKAYPLQFGFSNVSMSGDRSTDVLTRLRSEVLSRKVDILLIAVGVNDLIRRGNGQTQIEIYSEKLRLRCQEFNIPFIDLYALWQDIKAPDYLHDEFSRMPRGMN